VAAGANGAVERPEADAWSWLERVKHWLEQNAAVGWLIHWVSSTQSSVLSPQSSVLSPRGRPPARCSANSALSRSASDR
jgi:hypothetical protein